MHYSTMPSQILSLIHEQDYHHNHGTNHKEQRDNVTACGLSFKSRIVEQRCALFLVFHYWSIYLRSMSMLMNSKKWPTSPCQGIVTVHAGAEAIKTGHNDNGSHLNTSTSMPVPARTKPQMGVASPRLSHDSAIGPRSKWSVNSGTAQNDAREWWWAPVTCLATPTHPTEKATCPYTAGLSWSL
jgi:hypothetical protein